MIEQDRSREYTPEQKIQKLVSQIDVRMELNYKFNEYGLWNKQYCNTSDPDGEYEVRYNQETLDLATRSKEKLICMGMKSPEMIEPIIMTLLKKDIPKNEPKYILSRTETGFQKLTPEPEEESDWTWVSGTDIKKMIDEIIFSFGTKALPYLEPLNTKRSQELIKNIKRQEFRRKIKALFKSS